MKEGNKTLFFIILLIFAFLLGTIISIFLGGSHLSFNETVNALFLKPDAGQSAIDIVWKIRIPRLLLGIFVGIGLSSAGCVFQGILRNPLADPYTLGISGGAALGATIGLFAVNMGLWIGSIHIFSFAGALFSIFIVLLLSKKSGYSSHTMILGGIAIGFVFSSLVLLFFAVMPFEKMQSAFYWLMGDLSGGKESLMKIAGFTVILGTVVLMIFGRILDIMTLGDEKSSSLGINTGVARAVFFIIASFITAACVSAAGIIGFVGLMVPHFARKAVGPKHAILIPVSALGGAFFLPLCDTVSRTLLYPSELPVGIVTGVIGGVFFMFLLFWKRKRSIF